MKDVIYIAAFPKSGITYLNFMLFHILFDCPQDARRIDSDYIFDVHESLARVPPPDGTPRYVKLHLPFSPQLPLGQRANRAIYLLRDPIDVMMSVWDFKHLTGEDRLLEASAAQKTALFRSFVQHWLVSGGFVYPFAGSWIQNVATWLDQRVLPLLVVRYDQLRAQPFQELRRILAFLNYETSDERIAAAIQAGKPDNMRKLESDEIEQRLSGIFYRPGLAKGYARGYRFVGRMHSGSSAKVLDPTTQQHADRIFGALLARAYACAR